MTRSKLLVTQRKQQPAESDIAWRCCANAANHPQLFVDGVSSIVSMDYLPLYLWSRRRCRSQKGFTLPVGLGRTACQRKAMEARAATRAPPSTSTTWPEDEANAYPTSGWPANGYLWPLKCCSARQLCATTVSLYRGSRRGRAWGPQVLRTRPLFPMLRRNRDA
jgi:hypothetical protein